MEDNPWRAVSRFYGVKHPAAMNWYKKWKSRESISDIVLVKEENVHDENSLPDVLGNYGTIPSTGYISELSNDDWIEEYIGFTWKEKYLTQMRDDIWFSQKLLLLTFRFGGKTTTMACLFIRWILEKHSPIVCFGNKIKLEDISMLVLEILKSEKIRRAYGDVIARNMGWSIWLVPSMRIATDGSPMTDPNLSMTSKLSVSIGRHAGDDGWLHLEDLWQESDVTPAARLKSRNWLVRTIRYMLGKNTKFTVTGTRKDIDDEYQFIIDKLYFPVLKQELLIVKEGRLPSRAEVIADHDKRRITYYPTDLGVYELTSCPRWTMDYAMYEFLFHTEIAEAELNNNPLPSQGRFFEGDDWVEVEEMPNGLNYILIDPAFGESKLSSKTAIIAICIGEKKSTIIDAFIGRLGLNEKADMIVDFHGRHRPVQTLMEDNVRQMTSRYAPDHQLMKLRGLRMIHSIGEKRGRIESIKFSFSKREQQILDSCPFKIEIKAEYLTYSKDDSDAVVRVKYNALDAISMGYIEFKHLLSGNSNKSKIGTSGRRY